MTGLFYARASSNQSRLILLSVFLKANITFKPIVCIEENIHKICPISEAGKRINIFMIDRIYQ